MGMQTVLILALAALAAASLVRGLWKAFASGSGCASGCGSCAKACPVKTLEAIQRRPMPRP